MGKRLILVCVLWASRKSWLEWRSLSFPPTWVPSLFAEISGGGGAASLSLNCSTCPSGLKSEPTSGCWR